MPRRTGFEIGVSNQSHQVERRLWRRTSHSAGDSRPNWRILLSLSMNFLRWCCRKMTRLRCKSLTDRSEHPRWRVPSTNCLWYHSAIVPSPWDNYSLQPPGSFFSLQHYIQPFPRKDLQYVSGETGDPPIWQLKSQFLRCGKLLNILSICIIKTSVES